jgi:hypothetical protein
MPNAQNPPSVAGPNQASMLDAANAGASSRALTCGVSMPIRTVGPVQASNAHASRSSRSPADCGMIS